MIYPVDSGAIQRFNKRGQVNRSHYLRAFEILNWFWQSKKALCSNEKYFVLHARAQQGILVTPSRTGTI